jgi:hypothetical protein
LNQSLPHQHVQIAETAFSPVDMCGLLLLSEAKALKSVVPKTNTETLYLFADVTFKPEQ